MSTVTLHDLSFRLRFSRAEIVERVAEVARSIRADYADREPVFVVVVNGAMFFAVDLLRLVGIPCTMACIQASSYGSGTQSKGVVDFGGLVPNVREKDVIIVEDIVDTGTTIRAILAKLADQHPRSVAVAAVVNKPAAHAVPVQVQYRCFEMESEFLVGYGLDYAGRGRELTDIYELIADSTSQSPYTNIN
ncbi:MAG: hypoxanthine phosphoribosyltransferase [Bacteroidota bacterium]|jgi:hypoxanthine phosphoribosyltransferase